MFAERSSRTMIRWIPVCGPGPRLYAVSVSPDGWTMRKLTSVGFPGSIAPLG